MKKNELTQNPLIIKHKKKQQLNHIFAAYKHKLIVALEFS